MSENGKAFLSKLDEEEKYIRNKADDYTKLLVDGVNDQGLTEDVRTDISAVIGEVNLLFKGKLKQFRGLCVANVTKSVTSEGDPTPLDSDLAGFWDITFPLIDKVKEKFRKLDSRKLKHWAPVEEFDPYDINNRPRTNSDERQHQQQKSKLPVMKKPTATSDTKSLELKKLIQERRKAAAEANNNHEIEIFIAQK